LVRTIGVAKDVKQAGIDQPAGTELYVPLDQIPRMFPGVQGGRLGSGFGDASMHLVLRTTLPAAALQPSIADALREVDPGLPVIRLRDMEDVFRD
jgi:hypothetical protein